MPRRLPFLALAMALALPALASVPASALTPGPVKCSDTDVTPDLRVFPEPIVSATFLRYDEFRCGTAYLAEQYPNLFEITTTGESRDGHDVFDILMTDETEPGPKESLLVVSSIHGDEVGGREGAVRVMEDMADPRFLGGEPWVQQVLDEFVIHFLFPNPDGWVNGDITGTEGAGLSSTRGNGSGRDLNRQFPVEGYISTPNATLEEPETQGIMDMLDAEDDWYLGTDNHGQGLDTYAAAGLQIVGEFDFQKSETLARFADEIDDEMESYNMLSQLKTLKEQTGQDAGPYHWGTLFDMLGYSASGSLIDYYNTVNRQNGYGFATELTMGSERNAATYPAVLNQIWVDSIRSINYTMFKQAIDKKQFTYEVGTKAAYLYDPAIVTDQDANGAGYERKPGEDFPQQPYAVSRMKFFTDLNKYASEDLTPVRVGDLLLDPADEGYVDLADFESLILANDAMPEPADEGAYHALLADWVEDGGNLVVTDAAASVLASLGLVAPGDISMVKRYVGYIDFTDEVHPLAAGLRGVARQTYDSVPIGFAFGSPGNQTPNWRVRQSAWEAAGGTTVGTNGSGQTAFGELPIGDGVVRFIGALLPDPTEEFYHPFGLQSYAVTYTGYTILENALNWPNEEPGVSPWGVDPSGGYSSGRISHVRNVPVETGSAFGGVVEGDYLYTSNARSFSIYDISDAKDPQLASITPLPVTLINEGPSTNGELLLLADDVLGGGVQIWDVSDKSAPAQLASVRTPAADHIFTCVLDCDYVYGSAGTIIDVRNPSSPAIVGNWRSKANFRNRHSIEEVAPGLVLTGSVPQHLLDARTNPADPEVVATAEPPTTQFSGALGGGEALISYVDWPDEAKSRIALSTLETPFSGDCNENSGSLFAYDTAGWQGTATFEVTDVYRIEENGTNAEGLAPVHAVGCSALGLDAHPDFPDSRVVAAAWAEDGIRLFHVTRKGKIVPIGGFIAPGTEAFGAMWGDESTLYVIDTSRGLDVYDIEV